MRKNKSDWITTIKIRHKVREELRALKIFPRQTYEDLILMLIDKYKKDIQKKKEELKK